MRPAGTAAAALGRIAMLCIALLAHSPARAQEVCTGLSTPPADAPAEIGGLLAGLAAALRDFPPLADAIARQDPVLCLTDTPSEAHGEFDPLRNRISISRRAPDGLRLAILVHETRHVEQFARGFCPANTLAMRENARAVFAMEADASAVSLLVTWTLRENGDPRAWEALAGWASQADIAAAFAEEMAASGDVERATAEAFDQWYRDTDRLESYYVASCSDYLRRQETSHALPRYDAISEGFFDRLCRMPDGGIYACREPAGVLSR